MSGQCSSGLSFRPEVSAFSVQPLTASLCDSHGMPQSGGSSMADSNGLYPFVYTYCALTISSGDTVRGGFDLAKSLICSLEKRGIQFSGVAQNITITFSDTECWPDGGPGDGMTSVDIVATGSAPASFNTHFEKGVDFTVASLGLNFKIAANLSSTKVEFIAHESWFTGDSNGNKGIMMGELDLTSGILKFEKRDERIKNSCANSSCGWNRHTRIVAALDIVNNEPKGLNTISYGTANMDVDATTLAASTSNGRGSVITASGNIESGVKARLFKTNSSGSVSYVKDISNYAEVANTGCATSAGVDTGSNCTSESGINFLTGISNTKFLLYASTAHTSPEDLLASFAGFTMTTVDANSDLP